MKGIFQSYRFALGVGLFRLGLLPLSAAPLTWFPGPAMDYPGSDAATVVMPGLGNVVIAGTTAYPEALNATNIYWTPLGQPFYGNLAPGAVASGGSLIVYGGNDGNSSVSTVINYSPSDGSSALASMSVPRSFLGCAPDRSGNAYAIGGLDGSGNPLASAEVYNQDNATWSPIASLPAARYNFPAVFDRTNYIYIFGGYTDTASGVETADVLRYSISKNTWTNLAAMPVATADSAAALGMDGNFYVVGGTSGGVPTDAVQVYNPANNSWSLSTPLPEPLTASSMGVDSLGRLIVMGGSDTNGYDTGDVWRSQQLGVPDSPPVFTQIPATTNAKYQAAYVSSINAAGNPQPVYLLVSGPTNLTVDYFSGAISWTPQGIDQIGVIPVTIAATNYAGATNCNLTITVPNPPPTVPTNLTVVTVTENSVTLSWSPADPVFGPATYTIAIPHPYHSPKGSGGGINYQVIASGIPTNVATISGLTPNSGYTFDIKATAPGGTSGYAGIGFTTLGPQPPANPRVTGLTSTSTSIAWNPSPGPVPIVSYSVLDQIYVNYISGPVETNVSGIIGTTMSVTGQTPGTQHYYFLYAYDAAGNASAPAILGVNNPVPVPPRLTISTSGGYSGAAPSPAGGGFQLTATAGSSLQTFLIQATTNPADPNSWVQIGSLLPAANPFTFTDTNAAQFPVRFYRVVAP